VLDFLSGFLSTLLAVIFLWPTINKSQLEKKGHHRQTKGWLAKIFAQWQEWQTKTTS